MDIATLRKILSGEIYGKNIALCEMKQVLAEYDALRTVLAHAYSEMSLDGVAQNISSAMFAEMRRMLGRRKAED